MMIAAVLMTTGFILGGFYIYERFVINRKKSKEEVHE